jgi:hypothetical protein
VAEGSAPENETVIAAKANNLRIDAATTEAFAALNAAEVAVVLLKGPALSPWYTDDPARAYLDCDLWVQPDDVERAGRIIGRLGFTRTADEAGLPQWWLAHATTWWREHDGVAIDLHRFLQGVGVDPQVAWNVLAADAEAVEVAGHPTAVLATPARALYVTLHAAHHGRAWGKALIHLERALAALGEAEWRAAAALAEQVNATESFAAGLRLDADGAELAERLGLPITRSVEVALRAGSPPPTALGFDQIATAPGIPARARVILRKAFPPPGFIRHWWRPAGRSRIMLVVGYLYRPLWLLQNAPGGFRAWREARKRLSTGGR